MGIILCDDGAMMCIAHDDPWTHRRGEKAVCACALCSCPSRLFRSLLFRPLVGVLGCARVS